MSALLGQICWTGSSKVSLEDSLETLKHRGQNRGDVFCDQQCLIQALRSDNAKHTPALASCQTITVGVSGEFFARQTDINPAGQAFGGRIPSEEIAQRIYESTQDKEGVSHYLSQLSGNFALAIYDRQKKRLWLARDLLGAEPIFWTQTADGVVFASECRALLALQEVRAKVSVNLEAIDQLMTWPGVVSPNTFFQGIHSVGPGELVCIQDGDITSSVYADLNCPLKENQTQDKDPSVYVEELDRLFTLAVARRLDNVEQTGFLCSGGIDSSMVDTVAHCLGVNNMRTFSIGFDDVGMDEQRWQKDVVDQIGSEHYVKTMTTKDVYEGLAEAVLRAECPLKESYNACSLQLAKMLRDKGCNTVLSGEGADELFAGYAGYLLDTCERWTEDDDPLAQALEEQKRRQLWGNSSLFYERDYAAHESLRQEFYAEAVRDKFASFNATRKSPIDVNKIKDWHPIHQRMYLDAKLRVADHELSDHGDRVFMTYGIVGRYPFLDRDIIDFCQTIPAQYLTWDKREKYLIRKMGEKYVPQSILDRRKFSFVASGTPDLLKLHLDWVEDLLSYDNVKKAGYFDADVVENLKKVYLAPGFKLNQTFEEDFLMQILSFHLWLDLFKMPRIG